MRGLMGTRFLVQARVSSDEQAAALDRALERVDALERLWSPWIVGSDVQRINVAAGAAVVVQPATLALIARSRADCLGTGGAFDPTFFALDGLWDLRARPFVPPTDAAIGARLPAVGCEGIAVDPATRSVTLLRPGAALHLGGNAKGTALDAVAALLRGAGLADFFVDGGGDVVVAGRGPNGAWRVGVADGRSASGAVLARLTLDGGAVATSGDGARYAMHKGRRYHHILDPRSGKPAMAVRQVTVVVPPAEHAGERADALATALFVLGPRRGKQLLDRHPGVDALWIDASGAKHVNAGMAKRLRRSAPGAKGP